MYFIHIKNLHRAVYFMEFNFSDTISRKITMNKPTAFQLSTVVTN